MVKHLKSVFAVVLAFALLAPAFFAVGSLEAKAAEATPFEYVTGGNPVSDSYKDSKFYDYLSRVKITGDGRTDVIAVALTQSGYLESDIKGDFSGTYVGGWKDFTEYNYNMGDWGAGYGYDESIGAAMHWCASFVSWALLQSRVYTIRKGSISDWCRKNTSDPTYMWREVGVGHWADQVKRAGYFKDPGVKGGTYKPLTGDIIFFTWDGSGRDHIGLVVYSDENYVYTVEGNTDDSEFADNSACCAVKSYPLNSQYIYGYGAMPYKSNSELAIDFSGKNRTTGYYMNTNGEQSLYADESCTGDAIGRIIRNTMFYVTEICDNGMLKVVSEVYGGSVRMGYINPAKTRTLQITSEEYDSKIQLELLTASATGIYYKDYTESTLAQIRSTYLEAKELLADDSATDAQYNALYNKLNGLLNNKGTNEATNGARVDCFDQRISAGICTILTSDFNGGEVTSANANLTYAVALKAKWDASKEAYEIVEFVSYANGVPATATVASDEIVIAAHDWETNVTDGAVFGSAANFKTLMYSQVGQYIKLYGIDVASKTIEPGAYLSVIGDGSGENQPTLSNVAQGKTYTGKGYIISTGEWPSSYNANLTDGIASGTLTYDNDWFGFCKSSGDEGYTNAPNGIGEVVIDLGKAYDIRSIKVNTFVGNISGIAAPARITAYVSNSANGTFAKLGDLAMGSAYNEVAWANLDVTTSARYVKIEVELAAGSAFTFINEVMVIGGENLDDGGSTDSKLGDVTGDGKVDSADYLIVKRACFNSYKLSTEESARADVDTSGKVDSTDYVIVKRISFGTYTA